MTLPVGQLARTTIQVKGADVEFRSLSRKETLEMAKLKDDPDAAEIYMLARATESSDDEVRAFRDTTSPLEVENLLDAILKLSGIDQMAETARARARADGSSPNA